jgi:hypothetical protein
MRPRRGRLGARQTDAFAAAGDQDGSSGEIELRDAIFQLVGWRASAFFQITKPPKTNDLGLGNTAACFINPTTPRPPLQSTQSVACSSLGAPVRSMLIAKRRFNIAG